jgi:CHAT domain-containing protein
MAVVGAEAPREEPLTIAEGAHALVQADAQAGAAMAQRALRLARVTRDREAEVAALHALGFARHELGDPRAIRTLRAAVRLADRNGLRRRAALARRPLAGALAYRGEIAAALGELDTAGAALDAHELARTEVFRISVLGNAGRPPASLSASNRALEVLRREGDTIWEARLLKNRGLLLAWRGDAAAAEADLARARDLYAGLGAVEASFAAQFELAGVALTRGDLPTCLARLDAIEAGRVSPRQRAGFELLRAQALTAGRLAHEARDALERAQRIWRRAGVDDPLERLEVVRLTLVGGHPTHAHALAAAARRSFAAQHRDVYHARATGLWLSAAVAAGVVGRSALRPGRAAVAALSAAGWRAEAEHVRLVVARAAIELGSVDVARRELAACGWLRRNGQAADRVEARHVEALIRLHEGDPGGAERAARSGLRLLDAYRAALGASDLRATASEIGVELAQLGLRIALARADPSRALVWSERMRANALRLPPVTPPSEPELRDEAAELRRVSDAIARAQRADRPARSLIARQTALEASIRRTSRHASGKRAPRAAIPRRAEIARALGERVLVELIELDGTLTALTLTGRRLVRHELGSAFSVKEELDWLRFALTRLTRRGLRSEQRASVLEGARRSAEAIDGRLIAPLADVIGEGELVIVPTGPLHALPWSMLPSLRGRPVVVAPSVVTWMTLCGSRPRRREKVALVAGPRLRHAGAELAGISALYPRPGLLAGREATSAAVMDALEGASVAHVACHGRFRADSPLFSALELADGPLNVYELQRLRRAPQLVVLSACDLATSDTRPGDELLGFAAALIGMGTRTIVASVVPVPDSAAKQLMIALHRHLTAGCSPAAALAAAQKTLRQRRSGFVCIGAG